MNRDSQSAPIVPGHKPEHDHRSALTKHERQHLAPLGAERESHADLARALTHREREHAADTGRRNERARAVRITSAVTP